MTDACFLGKIAYKMKKRKIKEGRTKIPKTLFKRYAGKRVALVNGRVVVATNDAVESYRIAKKKYPDEKISIFHVPRREDKHLLI